MNISCQNKSKKYFEEVPDIKLFSIVVHRKLNRYCITLIYRRAAAGEVGEIGS